MRKLFLHLVIALLIPACTLMGVSAFVHKRLPFLRLSRVNPEEGRKIFNANCLRCHNMEQSPWLKLGPNLLSVRERKHIVNERELTVAEYVLQSILDPDAYRVPGFGVMPRNVVADLSDQQLRDLIAFVAGPGHEAEVAQLQIPPRPSPPPPVQITRQEAELAESVMRGKGACFSCHSYYQAPEYHPFAPNILQGAYKEIEKVKQAITRPSETIADEYRQTRIETIDGLVITGRQVACSDPSRIRMLVAGADGMFHLESIDVDQIDVDETGKPRIERLSTSPMPENFAQILTSDEIDAIAKLIVVLNE